MTTNPPVRPRPKADPMRTARLMEAVDLFTREARTMPADQRMRMVCLLSKLRGELGLL